MRKQLILNVVVLAAAVALTLVGCGGGGSGTPQSTSPPTTEPSTPPTGTSPPPEEPPPREPPIALPSEQVPETAPVAVPVPAPVPVAGEQYQSVTVAAAGSPQGLSVYLNAQGALGFRLLNGASLSQGSASAEVSLVKDPTGATFGFELMAIPGNGADLSAQLSAQGARGFLFGSTVMVGDALHAIYQKQVGAATTYAYAALSTLVPASSTDAMAQANAQGAAGFRHVGGTVQAGSDARNIYVQSSANGGPFSYRALSMPATDADLLAQINAQGAQGYRFKGAVNYSDGLKLVYEKDASLNATFDYAALDAQATLSAVMAQADAQAALGAAFAGNLSFPSGVTKALYVKAQTVTQPPPPGCTGLLCIVGDLVDALL